MWRGASPLILVACAATPAPITPPPPPAPPAPVAELPTAPVVNEGLPRYVPLKDAWQPPEDPAPPPTPPATPDAPVGTAAERKKCAARGGKLQPVCMGGNVECVLRYRDAGKTCTDKKDCTGNCLFAGTDAPPPGTQTSGKCQATSDSCGCAARVDGGRVGPVMCLD